MYNLRYSGVLEEFSFFQLRRQVKAFFLLMNLTITFLFFPTTNLPRQAVNGDKVVRHNIDIQGFHDLQHILFQAPLCDFFRDIRYFNIISARILVQVVIMNYIETIMKIFVFIGETLYILF